MNGLPNLPAGDAPRTVSCWVRVPFTTITENQAMFSYGTSSNGQRFSFRLNGGATQELRLEVGGGNIVGTTVVNDGLWHHLAAVIDDHNSDGDVNVDETRLYVDGSLENVSSSTTRLINTVEGFVPALGGSGHNANFNFTGEIDEFRMHPFAMTGTQVAAEVNASRQAALAWHRENFGPDPVLWSADSESDGWERLAEYAFGGNPHLADASSLRPAVRINAAGKLEIDFNRRLQDSHDLIYQVKSSTDLATWSILGVLFTGTAPHSGLDCFERAIFESVSPVSGEERQFIRVEATLAP